MRIRTLMSGGVVALATFAVGLPSTAGASDGERSDGRLDVGGIELLGEVRIPTGTMFASTVVGGLSGIAYDAERKRYVAISDDRSQFGPARYYTLSIDVRDGDLVDGDVELTDVVTLKRADGTTYPPLSLDPEGLALAPDGQIYVSSEGDANAGLAPFVNRYRRADGVLAGELPVPDAYRPTATSGIRNNLAFESLTLAKDGRQLVTATENALVQDGPAASLAAGSPARVLVYRRDQPAAEYRYDTDPVADTPVPAGTFATNGLVELLALDDRGTFLALERSFSNGVGNDVHLYRVELDDASRLRPGQPIDAVPALRKQLVLDLGELGLTIDNLEAMTFGPELADGRRSLIIVSDNNFSATQVTQFLAFAVDVRPARGPVARVATFNASLNRSAAGQLVADLSATPAADAAQELRRQQARNVAEVIQRTRPDVLLVNEFDYVEGDVAADLFRLNYLQVGHNGAAPIHYPYVYVAPSNTGIPSGFDLDNNGTVGGGNDAFGFGVFPGQFGMAVFSRFPIDTRKVRTFQQFRWADMPGNLIPPGFYADEERAVLRLSSKSHWDVPVRVRGEVVHFLVSHPTPPVFDGPEDRNGRRNHDEIRFWADYVDPRSSGYVYDDAGRSGGLKKGERFVIAGDQNADPLDGDSVAGAADLLLSNPMIDATKPPASTGGLVAAQQGRANAVHRADPRYDTADFADGAPGNLRVDYVLPSLGLPIAGSGVFWPAPGDPLSRLTGAFDPALLPVGGFPTSDHRLVWLDLRVR